MLKGQAGKDELLGFGAGEAISFLTPIALAVTVEVVKFITEEVRKSVKAESATLISDVVKSMFKKFRPAVEKEKKSVPLLTQEQLQEIHKIAVAKARQLKLSESKAKQLADGLIGDMVIYG